MNKSIHKDNISKSKRLCILLAIAMPIVATTVVWSWIESTLFIAIYYSTVLVLWATIELAALWKLSRERSEETFYNDKRVRKRRRDKVFETAILWSILIFSTAMLIWKIVSAEPAYSILFSSWMIVVSMGHLSYVGLLTDR